VEIETEGEELAENEIFGSVEAVKTVSDLFLPVAGKVLEVNTKLADEPELVNNDPYNEGWMIKMEVANIADLDGLLSVEAYKTLIGH
jgi:glycine cleavage system H protein